MNTQKAQSLMELGVIGAIILSILAIFLTYGLRNNYQQQVRQQAFRKAIAEASKERPLGNPSGSSSYSLIRDRHVVDAADPFGVGGTEPTSASYSIVRNYQMSETPDTIEELPHTTYDINGQIHRFLSAGFGDYCLTEECSIWQLKKYQEVYGAANVWYTNEEKTCIRVLDSCEGEIIDYSACKSQCRMITEVGHCLQLCHDGRPVGGGGDCGQICGADIEVPAYCGALESMFARFLGSPHEPGGFGPQADYSHEFAQDGAVKKVETPGGIMTEDSIHWTDTARRIIVYKPYHTTTAEDMPIETKVGGEADVPMAVEWP